ncbi:MAG: Gfo/Idh/MocA family oxidoreductase [Planctomycetota bacterium]
MPDPKTQKNETGSTRRAFLQASSASTLAALAAPHASGFHIGGRATLKVGLVGCGGRGTGAASDALQADPDTELVAMGDAFSDQLEKSWKTLTSQGDIASRVKVDADHQFVGFDAYKNVIDSCDVVLLATSPHFRPMHTRYAVEQNKQVFVEKPVAVDGPGLRHMLETCEMAKQKGLNILSGLCYRYDTPKIETMKRVHDGAIGDIVSLQATYNTGGLWHRGRKPEWSEMEYQMRNWLYFAWLSGDHAAEQHIHSLDKIAWAMKDVPPLKCTASGGRIQRTEEKYGNVYDHFNAVFEWPDDVKGFTSCRQWNGASANVSDFAFGTKGVAGLQAHAIKAEDRWRYRGETNSMYVNEHIAFFKAIRAGEPINNGDYMCNSTLMALMIRMSAYTGQTIGYEQALNSEEDLSPPAYEWGPIDMRPVAIPGVTKFL